MTPYTYQKNLSGKLDFLNEYINQITYIHVGEGDVNNLHRAVGEKGFTNLSP